MIVFITRSLRKSEYFVNKKTSDSSANKMGENYASLFYCWLLMKKLEMVCAFIVPAGCRERLSSQRRENTQNVIPRKCRVDWKPRARASNSRRAVGIWGEAGGEGYGKDSCPGYRVIKLEMNSSDY